MGIPLSLDATNGELSSKPLIAIAKDESGCLNFLFPLASFCLFVLLKVCTVQPREVPGVLYFMTNAALPLHGDFNREGHS